MQKEKVIGFYQDSLVTLVPWTQLSTNWNEMNVNIEMIKLCSMPRTNDPHTYSHTCVIYCSCLVLWDKVKPSCSWPEEIEWFYLDFLFGNKNHLIFLILWHAALESDERTYILLLREMAKLDNPELLSCKEDRKNTTVCCGVPAFIPSRLMWSTSLKSKREITDSYSRIITENNKAPSKITLTWCSFLQIKFFPKPNFIKIYIKAKSGVTDNKIWKDHKSLQYITMKKLDFFQFVFD